eukprot:4514596-Pleurochrysis_carterae.AAC.1
MRYDTDSCFNVSAARRRAPQSRPRGHAGRTISAFTIQIESVTFQLSRRLQEDVEDQRFA